MPTKSAAKKALRQAKKRAERNKKVRDAYKEALKAVKKELNAKKDVREAVRLAQKRMDKAAKRGVIKKRAAGRKLSRLMKKIHGVHSS